MRDQHITPENAQLILSTFPEKIQLALRTYALEIDFPIEAVIEMAISGFLDQDSMNFDDCKPLSGMNFMKRAS
jgi:hypothetical protein